MTFQSRYQWATNTGSYGVYDTSMDSSLYVLLDKITFAANLDVWKMAIFTSKKLANKVSVKVFNLSKLLQLL